MVVPGSDQHYVAKTSLVSEKLEKDRGIPQLLYAHNVLPTEGGYKSLNYLSRAAAISAQMKGFTKVYLIKDIASQILFMCVDVFTGDVYFTAAQAPSLLDLNWELRQNLATDKNPTVAYINGLTYFWFPGLGCYKYDSTTGTLVPQVLAGLEVSAVDGITSASGYMIAWGAGPFFNDPEDPLATISGNILAWSSTISETDFVPSLLTGAGSGSIQDASGRIQFVAPVSTGVIVYTFANAVGGIYSGNARFPFNFKELVGTGGLDQFIANTGVALSDLTAIGEEGNSVYAFTKGGIQDVNFVRTNSFATEISDFIVGGRYEDFDETTLQFTISERINVAPKKLAIIADRYLVISYVIARNFYSSPIVYTHAIIYDVVLQRIGKVRINHTDCFEFIHTMGDISLLSRDKEKPSNSIAFLSANGAIVTIDMSVPANASGVAIFGRYQLERNYFSRLEQVEFENVFNQGTFQVYDLISIDGKNYFGDATPGITKSKVGLLRSTSFHKEALNHSIVIIGAFDLNTIVLTFARGGRPR